MRICYRTAQRACKGILPRFLALAHSCVDTERLFSLERAFRAICAYCKRLYDDHVLSRSRQRASRARILLRTLRRTHTLWSSCICFAKMRRTFFPLKIKKRDRPSPFAKKRRPMSFSAARRFGGTAFCRRQENRAFYYSYFTAASGIDPCAPSQTAVFAVISGFVARIISFPVYNCVSKNTRRFRALSAFREVIAATSSHIRSASRSCRLSAFNAKASKLVRNSTRARCPA